MAFQAKGGAFEPVEKTYENSFDGDKVIQRHTVLPASEDEPEQHHLKRSLQNRHIAMISIGGVIGTGLFLGTGGALASGGPLGLFLGYTIMGSVCFSVMVGLGEMISYLPIEGGHIALAHRFVDPAWAFALSFNYAYNWLIILPAELSACAVLVNYWIDSINNGVWITIALVVVIGINLCGARGYGEAEFFFSMIKVLTITVLIFVGIAINCGAGPSSTGYKGFTYWKNPGPFTQYKGINGSLGQFLGFWSVLTQAAFSFIGTEIVAITAGEAVNPRRNLPRAIKKVYIRILLFYVLGTFIIGLIVASDNENLGTTSDAKASPFVIAIEEAGIKALPSIINACLITAAWSAASADLYTSSRALYGIALNGDLPKIFTRTTKSGLPYVALIVASLFSFLAYMGIGTGSGQVFGWLSNMSALAGLMSWFAISVTYLRFRGGMEVQGFDRSTLPYKSVFAYWGAWYAIVMIAIISFFSAWTVFLRDSWDTATFITNYLPLVIFPVLFVGKKVISKTTWRSLDSLDYITNIAEIEAEAYEEPRAATWYGRLANNIF
ncbi:amino acid permease [Mrakia frigida]|uniref:amino acid permease n=1 Tax=Mrakia frigida TaxID=29902 RepID=UPI003FCC0E04